MHEYRFPPPQSSETKKQALFGGAEDIALPFGADAFLIYSAWQNHGVMPYSGGLLDQPRAFKRLLHIMNALYADADEDETFTPFTFQIPSETPARSFADFTQHG